LDCKLISYSALPSVQLANITNLPENYFQKYYLYHVASWPELSFVAFDTKGNAIGYVLGKMDETERPKGECPNGHITSLSVMRKYRKLGVALRLVQMTETRMKEIYGAELISLHVRVSNKAALHLYQNSLGFETVNEENEYYADNESAYYMKKVL